MIFKRISRSDPERIFVVCENGYTTASLSNGQAVVWDMSDADGMTVTKNATGVKRMASFAGVVSETIAAGAYGLLQVYGYHSAVRVDSHTDCDIYTGCPLFADADGFNLEGPYVASGTTEELYQENRPVACAFEAYTLVGTTGTIKAMIFAL